MHCACLRVCVLSQVQATKAELNGLGDRIEEVRSVCRQLHTHLRQIPECNVVPFEGEADALMDLWLDVSSFNLKFQISINTQTLYICFFFLHSLACGIFELIKRSLHYCIALFGLFVDVNPFSVSIICFCLISAYLNTNMLLCLVCYFAINKATKKCTKV